TGSLLKKLRRFDEPVSACVWAADGASFILGTLDNKRSICTFDVVGEELIQWNKKHRVQALSASPDGRWLVAADNITTIYIYNAATRELEYELDLGTQPTSLSISQDSRSLLVNKADSEAQLIDLATRSTIHKFVGHKIDRFIIRSTFGGANESFVVSGSEDGNMFIWHKNMGDAVERLPGHVKRCNGATWNPADPCMLASCSDEGPIKMYVCCSKMFVCFGFQGDTNVGNIANHFFLDGPIEPELATSGHDRQEYPMAGGYHLMLPSRISGSSDLIDGYYDSLSLGKRIFTANHLSLFGYLCMTYLLISDFYAAHRTLGS
ncbi:hypothetical protein E4U54_001905, partial [Claviceps lovelessii]